jgi:aryl sulfotransferase
VYVDPPVRYRSPEEDSARWLEFDFRPGDIVISTRSKCGTTWAQMICLLLIFQTPELPAPLGQLSPWLDWLVSPQDELFARLEAQEHRRCLKTHTPLDGVVLSDQATYIVVGRHPLDMAVSLYHQRQNIDRRRQAEIMGLPEPADRPPLPPLPEWLATWVVAETDPRQLPDSLDGVLWHYGDAWSRRHEPNVVLVHYDDLAQDLEGTMRRMARSLDITVPERIWPDLVRAAGFEAMKRSAANLVPARQGILKDPVNFFRHGVSGDGRAALSDAAYARYRERLAATAPADVVSWLHHDH